MTGRNITAALLHDEALHQVASTALPSNQGGSNAGDMALDESFNIITLQKLRGVEIQWTDNLVDHLKLEGRPGRRTLFIYHNKISLANHRNEADPPIDKAILAEAMRTLDLLFPLSEVKVASLLKKDDKHFLDVSPSNESIRLNDFVYCRSNIVQLLNLIHGPPETVTQMLRDTSKISEFATVWVAIIGVFLLTILFGVLGAVYSIKSYGMAITSINLAKEANRIADEGYKLALAVACAEHPDLPNYCLAESRLVADMLHVLAGPISNGRIVKRLKNQPW